MNTPMIPTREAYIDFLKAKIPKAELAGFEPPSPCHPSLRPDQRDIAEWAMRGGRRAIFADFGLGKTRGNIQLGKWITEKTGGRYLIVAPLGVRQEFTRGDGPAMGVEIQYVRNNAEVLSATSRILITNYERVRDGDIDLSLFDGAALDEASVLRSYGSLTYQTFLAKFKVIPYRFVFTATPSPNRYKELIHYAAFLGIMDSGEALTRFFQRDSSQANNLTLYPHMVDQFHFWLHSWATFIQKPSDLGYSDEGFNLPPMHVHWIKLEVDHRKAWKQVDSWGQSQLFQDQAEGLEKSAEVKRDSIQARVSAAMEIMDRKGNHPDGTPRHWILWHTLEAERDAIERRIPEAATVYGNQDLEEREDTILAFSAGRWPDGRPCPILGAKPSIAGSGTNLQRFCADSIFIGADYKFNDFIQACHRIVRYGQKRECNIYVVYLESEERIVEELKAKWRRHDELMARMRAILKEHRLSTDTTYMKLMKAMGCKRTVATGERFIVILNDAITELMPCAESSVAQSSSDYDRSTEDMARTTQGGKGGVRPDSTGEARGGEASRQQRVVPKESGQVRSKKRGMGKEEPGEKASPIQALRSEEQGGRIGPDSGVVPEESPKGHSYCPTWGGTADVRPNHRGRRGDDKSTEGSVRHLQNGSDAGDISDRPLPQNGASEGHAVLPVQCGNRPSQGRYYDSEICNSLFESGQWKDNSVDMILTSVPFGNQYEYCPSFDDLGCNPNNEAFHRQMDFLIPNLLRILKPGRIAAIHVKDRIRFGNVTGDGFPVSEEFSDEVGRAFRKHGFRRLARITIDTDVVRENAQTYRLGWSENAKDSSKMGAGMPEYVLVFRKLPSDTSDGYADTPVTKPKLDVLKIKCGKCGHTEDNERAFQTVTGFDAMADADTLEWECPGCACKDEPGREVLRPGYSRADWQMDASGLWRSNGNRLPDPEAMLGLTHQEIIRIWRKYSVEGGYDHAGHVEIARAMETMGKLPSSFMLFPPVSRDKDIWTDIARMRTLNSEQSRRNEEMHVCPLQLDIIKRLITRYTNPGELVWDPFLGIGSVAYQAIKMGRRGGGTELNEEYWRCAVGYCEMAENEIAAPTLFDVWKETPEVAEV